MLICVEPAAADESVQPIPLQLHHRERRPQQIYSNMQQSLSELFLNPFETAENFHINRGLRRRGRGRGEKCKVCSLFLRFLCKMRRNHLQKKLALFLRGFI